MNAIANLVSARPRRVLAVTVVFAVAAGVLGAPVAGVMKAGSDNFEDPASESHAASKALERVSGASPDADVIAVVRPGGDVRGPQGMARVQQVAGKLASDRQVARVVSYAATHDPGLVSRDGRATYIAALFKGTSDDAKNDAAKRIDKLLGHERDVELGGPRIAAKQLSHQVSADLGRAEMLAFPLLFLLSLVFFRSLVAALLPPLLGGLAIVGALLGLRVASQFTDLSIFALNLITGVGLGLAIDYSLFIVSRYREELARVGPGREALTRTLATAGRTVLFTSLTVAAALASLLVFPQRFLYSMGVGGVIVALMAGTLALVALPALLAVLGPRVNALAPARLQRAAERDARPATAGAWYRLSRTVMRRPLPIALAAAVLLIALGLPFLGIRFTGLDANLLPKTDSAHKVYDVLNRDFPPHRTTPITIAVEAPRGGSAALARYQAQLRRLPGVAAVSTPRFVGATVWQVDVISRSGPLSTTTQDLVRRVRHLDTPLHARVAGQTARFVDQQSSLGSHLPLALALLATTTLFVLFVMTGSLVLPVKALVMNLLTVSAAFGLLVLVFQDGRLEGPLAYTSIGGLDSTQPLLLFALAFGLSTDYGVFLLMRIKEARD
ncbi:MAG: putative drug exporter of the superfamily, partial [Solirubrobacteraceae bacterium]|nr:putative drug exporter of the superfamily [Solirubrobacteraceae bacterium]